jgi:hypothetical protein
MRKPSAFISDQDATERFVCVEAQNANISTYLDINQENNTKCKNIEGSGFALVSVYPNPTDEDITISILLSETLVFMLNCTTKPVEWSTKI